MWCDGTMGSPEAIISMEWATGGKPLKVQRSAPSTPAFSFFLYQ
jgi:hypothetical protein